MGLTPAKDSADVGLLTEDIKRSLGFYEGLLGLQKVEEVSTPFGKFHRLRYGSSDVKLLDAKSIPPADPLGFKQEAGVRYRTLMAFEIQNISSVCATLKEHGVVFLVPETQVRPDARVAMLKDPDGNIIELIERK